MLVDMDSSSAAGTPTRAQVRAWWQDLTAGHRTRRQASAWAQHHLDQCAADEELVIQGLLALQACTLVRGEDDRPVHAQDPDAPFSHSMAELAADLTAWEAQLGEYDRDPDAWMRAHFRQMVSRFATGQGVDAARQFGRQLVDDGHLTADDVEDALGA